MNGKPSAREVERALGAELLEALRHHAQTSTEWAERLAGQLVNHTLMVWSGVFPTAGVLAWDFGVAAGSCYVRNLAEAATDVVTVVADGPQETAPTGLGTWTVPGAGGADTVPLASRQVTLYGAAGDRVQIQVYTAGVRPGTGAV